MSDGKPRKRDRFRKLLGAKTGLRLPAAASSTTAVASRADSLSGTTAPSTSSAQHLIAPTEPPRGAIVDATFKSSSTSQPGPTSVTAADTAHIQAGNKEEQSASTAASSADLETQSLWSRAINSRELSSYRKTLEDIDFGVNSLETASAIKSKMGEILSKKNGEEVVLRDVGTKILHWVDRFKQIGDIIVQYDPAHAALPWAGFRFVLQVGLKR